MFLEFTSLILSKVYLISAHLMNLTFLHLLQVVFIIKSIPVLFFSIKVLTIILFLILIRGGTPRYRYDFLTKIGWNKQLSLCLFFTLTIFILYFLI